MKVFAIVVAAGEGRRMGGGGRKQYRLLCGEPIIRRTLKAVIAGGVGDGIFLVVPKADFAFCERHVAAPLRSSARIHLVAGGARRQESVYNGLLAVPESRSIVVVHDGVRPMVAPERVGACISAAADAGACSLGIPAVDTLKSVSAAQFVVSTLPRESIWMVQTPQAFRYDLLRDAHERAIQKNLYGTDDAFLVEQLGAPVKMVPGSRWNIKITTPDDLALAEAVCCGGVDAPLPADR